MARHKIEDPTSFDQETGNPGVPFERAVNLVKGIKDLVRDLLDLTTVMREQKGDNVYTIKKDRVFNA